MPEAHDVGFARSRIGHWLRSALGQAAAALSGTRSHKFGQMHALLEGLMPERSYGPVSLLSRLPPLSETAAGGIAGLVAGAAYLGAQMIFSTALGLNGPFASLQRIGAILLGEDAVPPGHTLPIELAMGGLIHLPLSLVFGLCIGRLVRNCNLPAAALRGAMAGLALFGVIFFVVAPSAFPWFLDVRNPATAFDHAMFGALAGWLSIALQRSPAGVGGHPVAGFNR